MKASRDVLVHNAGVANRIYLEKAGARARCLDGEPLEITGPYHREAWALLGKVIGDVAEALASKSP